MGARSEKIRAYRKGIGAEWVAAGLLMLKGYKIAGWRVKTPVGEIDLVAQRGRVLAFVEVKTRRRLDDAIEAVHRKNRNRIAHAARYYISGHPKKAMLDLRFDVIALAPPLSLRHIEGAWDNESHVF